MPLTGAQLEPLNLVYPGIGTHILWLICFHILNEYKILFYCSIIALAYKDLLAEETGRISFIY